MENPYLSAVRIAFDPSTRFKDTWKRASRFVFRRRFPTRELAAKSAQHLQENTLDAHGRTVLGPAELSRRGCVMQVVGEFWEHEQEAEMVECLISHPRSVLVSDYSGPSGCEAWVNHDMLVCVPVE